MSMDWIRAGIREEEIRSLFTDDTWDTLYEAFPELKEVSVIGEKGTGKHSTYSASVEKDDRVEVYVTTKEPFKKEKHALKFLKRLHAHLLEQKISDDTLEVKLETGYIGDFSGFVLREDLTEPKHFWHHQGIPGFSERISFSPERD